MDPSICETCWHWDCDEETGEYYCRMELDEDEFERIFSRSARRCPFYQKSDEYYLPRHQ